MRLLILTLAVVISCAAAANISLNNEWDQFKTKFGKVYADGKEEITRRAIWERNLRKIEEHNIRASRGLHSYRLGVNKYADLTSEEFVNMMNGYNKTKNMIKTPGQKFVAPADLELPTSVDWRTKGYVTPIKDQGQCGSCWSFSAVASLEGQHFKKSGTLVSLSEQNLVDCSRKYGNNGCNGGLMDNAFTYIKANKGIDTEESYPYHAVDQKCKFKPANVGATDTGFVDVESGNEDDLTKAIATVGPISVAIDASQESFQLYSDGVYDEPDCSSSELDHGVTAVGYGVDQDGTKYYIVKNSWGEGWGQQGYIWMSRGKDNQCGIATSASYPTV